MSKDTLHTGLGVVVRRDTDSGMDEFGVLIDGGFIGFGARKSADVDDAAEAGKAQAAAASSSSEPPSSTVS